MLSASRFLKSSPVCKNVTINRRNIPKRFFLQVIHQGSVAYRTRLGRNPILLNPGIHLNLPIIHKTRIVDMREICMPIKELVSGQIDNSIGSIHER